MRRVWLLIGAVVVAALVGTAVFYAKKLRIGSIVNPSPDRKEMPSSVPLEMELVRLDSPVPGSLIKSPLTVTGQARGFWFFEASFPVRVLDANGKELGVGIAQAEGPWMTVELVPFRANVEFKAPATDTGFLVLEKDNPSGLPENAQEIRYPVRFR